MSRAMLNAGVFRKPIANATPEGNQRTYDPARRRVFRNDIAAKTNPKTSMNFALSGGRWPLPASKSAFNIVIINNTARKQALTKKASEAQPHVSCRSRERRTRYGISTGIKIVSRSRHHNAERRANNLAKEQCARLRGYKS